MELLTEREKVNNALKWHEKQMFNFTHYPKHIVNQFDHLLVSDITHYKNISAFQLLYIHRTDLALISI